MPTKLNLPLRYTLLWWLALILLLAGLLAPLFTIHRLWIFDNTVSLLGGLQQMAAEGEWLLFIVIGLFSVVFPILKLVAMFPDCHGIAPKPLVAAWMKRLNALGKWSMLDVFVVAVLVVAIKLGSVVKVEIRYGLYLFTLAVMLTMIVAWMLANETKKN